MTETAQPGGFGVRIVTEQTRLMNYKLERFATDNGEVRLAHIDQREDAPTSRPQQQSRLTMDYWQISMRARRPHAG